MTASLRYNGRLPGVVVNTALPPQQAPLRLDIAAFVGFAERGPRDTPVALEDIGQYEAVFGGDIAVARDGGRPVYAALPSAVRSFFDNGGRRCYAVRVAGADARPGRFPLPGMVELRGTAITPATVEAAWVGRWSDQMAVMTQLLARPLRLVPELTSTTNAGGIRTLALDLPTVNAVVPGDLLRLQFGADAPQAYFTVDAVAPLRVAGIGRGVLVAAQGQLATEWAFRPRISPLPALEAITRLATGAPIAIDADSRLIERDDGYELRLSNDVVMQPGELLRITCAGDMTLLFPVADAGRGRAICIAPHWLAEAPPTTAPTNVELLRFALRVRLGETVREHFDELPFGPGANDWTSYMCAWADNSEAGPPQLPAQRSTLLRVPPTPSMPRFLPIGMPTLPPSDAFFGPREPGDDDLATFAPWDLFLDQRLRDFSLLAIMPEAERLLYLSDERVRLRGLHSLIPVEEVALVAIPDLAQRGWPARTLPPPIDPPPATPEPPAPPDWSSFHNCAQPAPPALAPDEVVRRFYGFLLPILAGATAPGLDESARALLSDELRAALAAIELPAAIQADEPATSFTVNLPPCAIEGETITLVLGTLFLVSGVELQTSFTLVRRDDSWAIDQIASRLAPNEPSETQRRLAQLPLLLPKAEYAATDLVRVQAAMIRLCAARADMSAIISLPDFFGRREASDWQSQLETTVGLPTNIQFSYAAAYYPWLSQRETATPELAPLRAVPPDGAACGMIAAREHERGVWIAPAGIPLRGVVGLVPDLSEAEAGDMFDAPTQINIVRQQPGRFVALSAHTLSPERIYWQLGVRRLLILLRKAALRRGMQYVFQTNNEQFRRQVRGGFERMLSRLAQLGALEAYQVIADDSLNTQNDRDNGRFLVALKVAPVSPVEFITVTLLRSGEDVLTVQER